MNCRQTTAAALGMKLRWSVGTKLCELRRSIPDILLDFQKDKNTTGGGDERREELQKQKTTNPSCLVTTLKIQEDGNNSRRYLSSC